jgi:8-oxo-dGTP diphosphatase
MRVAAAVIRRDGQILLVKLQGPDHDAASWALPGGRVLPDEPIIAALYREVREETGLRVTAVGRLLWAVEVRSQNQPDVQALVYEASVDRFELLPADPDGFVLEARFVGFAEADRLIASTLPWRSMSEPLLAFLRGTAVPGTNWFYRTGEDEVEVLELALAPGDHR